MEISQFTLKLIILLIPGGIGAIILERLTVHKAWSSFRFVLNTIIIGFCSYGILQILVSSLSLLDQYLNCFSKDYPYKDKPYLFLWDTLNDKPKIPYIEIILAMGIAIILGFILTKADTYKWLNNFAKRYKISDKYGDEPLFSYFLNLKDTEYVYIRHIKHNFTYLGYVSSFSENEDFREVVLSNVTVYSYDESEELYQVSRLYLCLEKDDIIIEHAQIINNEEQQESTSAPAQTS